MGKYHLYLTVTSQQGSWYLDLLLLLLLFFTRILWKNSFCMFIVFIMIPPHVLPPTLDFCMHPFLNDSTVLCVRDQGECFRPYVGTETTQRPPPVGRFQMRRASDSSQPNRLFEAAGDASSPPLRSSLHVAPLLCH